MDRRSFNIGVLAWLATGRLSMRAAPSDDNYPPVFMNGRFQFTVLEPRKKMPPLELTDMGGRQQRTSFGGGRVTLLNYWATWCAACRSDLVTLQKIQQTRDDVRVVAICVDHKTPAEVTDFLDDAGVDQSFARMAPQEDAVDPSSLAPFSIYEFPKTFLVGPSGYLEGYIAGSADWTSPAGEQLLEYYKAKANTVGEGRLLKP